MNQTIFTLTYIVPFNLLKNKQLDTLCLKVESKEQYTVAKRVTKMVGLPKWRKKLF